MHLDGHSFEYIANQMNENAEPGEHWTPDGARQIVQLGAVSQTRVVITKKQLKRSMADTPSHTKT
jgi:hypothetical protein